MKVVINTCFGGFSLSPLAVQEIAKRKGKECFFFEHGFGTDGYKRLTLEEASKSFCPLAYSVPNPEDYNLQQRDEDGLFKSANARAEEISLNSRPNDRSDSDLIAVIELLGGKAGGKHSELKIVEIPDGVEYIIEEYDGSEHIAEKHRTWS